MSEPHEPQDPRIRRTLVLIRDALVSLMEEKGFEQITVRDLTGRAEINRATFYLHYQDKYDLLDKLLQRMLHEFESAFRLPPGFEAQHFALQTDTPPDSFVRQLEHIAANSRFYKVMLGPKGIPGFSARMEAVIRDSLYHRSVIAEPSDSRLLIERDLTIRYFSAAHMGVIVYWLEKGMPFTPPYMAAQLFRLHRLNTDQLFQQN